MSRSGIAHPNFKHGLYSKALPVGSPLATAYLQARQHPDLIAHVEQVALMDARIEQLIGRLATGESENAWERARDALDQFRDAQKARDGAAMVTALTSLTGAIQDGQSDAAIWAEIRPSLFLRKKLVEAESRRRKDAQEMVTKDKLLVMLGFLAQSVARHVSDPRQRQGVVDDMRLLTAGGAR